MRIFLHFLKIFNKKLKNIQTNLKINIGEIMKEYEKNSSIKNLITETMDNLKTLTSSSTIFGEATILPDGTSIIPVSKLTIGFVVGGGEYADLSTRRVGTCYPMAGGSGGGISSMPIGFIVNTPNEIKFISTANSALIENLMEKLSKIGSYIKNKAENKE